MTEPRLATTLAQLLVLALWLGAAAFMTLVVAQAAFAVLPTRTLAGALVGRVLPVLFYTGMLAGVVVIALGWLAGALRSPVLLGGAAAIVVACAVAQFVIGAKIDAVRARIAGPIDALAATDPLRVAFGRLHAFSVAWLGVAIVAALLSLYLTARATSAAATLPRP